MLSPQKYERIDILGELRGEVMVYQPMTVTQISEGGARIESPDWSSSSYPSTLAPPSSPSFAKSAPAGS